ncbi:MAG: hemerythrin domain-containing protein [Candidatus Eremiobacteraeota bacterium]|nr:hemerythrin domain-containing protein [Candidatus Eremiobacteraeota bacterium]
MDITQLIADDHHEQRRLFAVLEEIDCRDVASLTAVWGRLAALLEVHAKAEEEVFYPELLRLGRGAGGKSSAEAETKDAIHDHNQIRDAVAAVGGCDVGTETWTTRVAKANAVNSDHMGEEEREALADFRRHAPLPLRHDLAVAFAAFEAVHVTGVDAVNTNPRAYVAAHASAAAGDA